jgi:hypothetical protein
LCEVKVAQIRIMFIVKPCDLNADVFNDFIGYHVLLNYGPHGGYLKRLQSERGSMFHIFQMTRFRLTTINIVYVVYLVNILYLLYIVYSLNIIYIVNILYSLNTLYIVYSLNILYTVNKINSVN